MVSVTRRKFIAGSACTASLATVDIVSGSPVRETTVRWKTRVTESQARYNGATTLENGDIAFSATILPQDSSSTGQIIRITADGEIRWRWSPPQELEDAYIGGLSSLGDGAVVAPFWDGFTLSLVNVDSAGRTNWTYERTAENLVGKLQTASDSDRLYVIGTSRTVHNPVTLIYAVDSTTGKLLWEHAFEDYYGPTVIQNTEPGCIAGGNTISGGAWLAKFTNTGSIRWKHRFDSATLEGVSVLPKEPGATVVVENSGQNSEILQYRLVSLDADGEIQRSKLITTDYDANEYEDVDTTSLIRHPESGYVVAESYRADFYTIRNISFDDGSVSAVTMDGDITSTPRAIFDTDDGYRLAGWSGQGDSEYLWAMSFGESLLSEGAGETAGTDEVARSPTETDVTEEPSSRTPVTNATTEATTADGSGFGVVTGLSAAALSMLFAGRGRQKPSG